jgi:hypothetical protein
LHWRLEWKAWQWNEWFHHFREISFDCGHVPKLLKRMTQFVSPLMMCPPGITQSAHCSCVDFLLSLLTQRLEIRLKILINVRRWYRFSLPCLWIRCLRKSGSESDLTEWQRGDQRRQHLENHCWTFGQSPYQRFSKHSELSSRFRRWSER